MRQHPTNTSTNWIVASLILCSLVDPTPLSAQQAIPTKILDQIKAATVFVRTAAGPIEGSGTGFVISVDAQTAHIVTNEHVVVPPKVGQRTQAANHTVVFHSGTKLEKKVSAELLAADPERDLAVLKVSGVNELPLPLDIKTPVELSQTMSVYIIGFPFGKVLSATKGFPDLTIGRGSISRLPKNEQDEIVAVQIDGNINPGNSGGPVVTEDGRLVGVSVAAIRGTGIGLAIPPRELTRMLEGRLGSVKITPSAPVNGTVDVRVEVLLIDPMRRLSDVEFHIAPSTNSKPKPERTESGAWPVLMDAETTKMKAEGQTASGTVKLHSAEMKEVDYMFQVSHVGADGKRQYSKPTAVRVNFGSVPIASITRKPNKKSTSPPRPDASNVPGDSGPISDGATRTFGDLSVTEIKVNARNLLPCVFWSANGEDFWCVDGPAGELRRIRLDGTREEAHVNLGSRVGWLSMSSKGLVATLPDRQEVWRINPETLEVNAKIAVASVTRAVSSPALSVALACNKNDLFFVDLEQGKVVKQYGPQNFEARMRVGFGMPMITPDGRFLFTYGGLEQLHRFKVEASDVTWEESSQRIGQNAQTIIVSANSAFVCLPSGGGNYQNLKDHPGNVGPYCTYIYPVERINQPQTVLRQGAYPRTVTFDASAERIYAQDHNHQLVIFNKDGVREKDYQFDKGDTCQILVHPTNGKLLLLTAERFYRVERER